MESVANLHGSDLLVLGIAVEGVRGIGCHKRSVELRCTGDETCVQEEVVEAIDVVVDTTFDCSAEEADNIRLLMRLIVVEAVNTPIIGVTERTVDEGGECIFDILECAEHTFLHHMTGVVTINNVAYVHLLVRPGRIVSVTVVCRRNRVYARRIDKVIT